MRVGFTDNIGIEGSYAYLFAGGVTTDGDDVDTFILNLGLARLNIVGMFNTDGMFRPYVKGGVLYGKLNMSGGILDEIETEGGAGAEAAVGFELGSKRVAWILRCFLKEEIYLCRQSERIYELGKKSVFRECHRLKGTLFSGFFLNPHYS